MSEQVYLDTKGIEIINREPNLKDLATLMYSVMPRWVTKQLAIELSNRLSLDASVLINHLLEIEEEYSKISREESLKRLDDILDRDVTDY